MRRRTLLAALGGAMLLSGVALAQAPSPTPLQSPPPSVTPPSAASGMEALERRLAGFHRALGITPAQDPQWEAFASIVRRNAVNMADLLAQSRGRAGSMSALDQLHFFADSSRRRADDVQRLLPAFEPLYDVMSAEQRATADRIVRQLVSRGQRQQGGR